jgi:hypothetical protein
MLTKFDTLYEKLTSRYDYQNDLGVARGMKGSLDGSQATKYGSQQYKKDLNQYDKSSINKSKKDDKRRARFRNNQTTLAPDEDGKRTTKKIGGRVNSKTDMVVVGKRPNGDSIVRKDMKRFTSAKPDGKINKLFK